MAVRAAEAMTTLVTVAFPSGSGCPAGKRTRCYVADSCHRDETHAMAPATQTPQNVTGGEFVDPAEGGSAAVLTPATGQEIAQAPESTQADVDRAVAAA